MYGLKNFAFIMLAAVSFSWTSQTVTEIPAPTAKPPVSLHKKVALRCRRHHFLVAIAAPQIRLPT